MHKDKDYGCYFNSHRSLLNGLLGDLCRLMPGVELCPEAFMPTTKVLTEVTVQFIGCDVTPYRLFDSYHDRYRKYAACELTL